MVSLWPWKGDATSAASFEKTLSALSSKITKANIQIDRLKFRARRLKALWTLYTIFAYILGCLILFLVTGRDNWTAVEYTVVGASPFVIYAVRTLIATYYKYRISSNEAQVENLDQQKEVVIQKLKDATKYNSTQQLLDKYGGVSKNPRTPTTPKSENKRESIGLSAAKQPSRTNLPPPPTANIQRSPDLVSPGSPESLQRSLHEEASPINTVLSSRSFMRSPSLASPISSPNAEFAPNAFSSSSQYAADSQSHSRWYDRIMDVLLGDDETRASNRLALICTHCRLVNGQAPPGTKRLEDVGRWRCSNCKEWNGRARDVHEILAQASKDSNRSSRVENRERSQSVISASEAETPSRDSLKSAPHLDDDDSSSAHEQLLREAELDVAGSEKEKDTTPAKSTRGRTKKNK